MKVKIFTVMALLIMSLFAAVTTVSAADAGPMPLEIESIWINDKEVDWYCFFDEDLNEWDCGEEIRGDLERGEKVEVEVKLVSYEDLDNVEVEAELKGYEHGNRRQTSDSTDLFDMKENRVYYKTLELELPEDMENEEVYALRIEVSDRDHQEEVWNILLEVNTPRHSMNIDDVLFSPGTTVEAGRSLLTSIRVENFGQKDEDNVKVTFSIPELGVSDSDYIDTVEAGDEKMSEELYLRIPVCTEGKDYKAKVTVDYDDGYETEEEEFTITVVSSDRCAAPVTDKTVITVGPETQNIVAAGDEAIYPVAVTNSGSGSRTYTLSLTAGDWATTRLSENVLVIDAGETRTAFVYVAAKDTATAGEKVIGLNLKSGDLSKDITLKADVVKEDSGNSWGSLKRGLEIGLVVLVVLLVVIGLIIGFSRLKSKDDEDSDEDKTYY